MHNTVKNLLEIDNNIKDHLNKLNINKRSKIIAVSKTFKIDKILPLIEYGHIDFGEIKAKFGGSSAGHNGIESIDKFIGKDYSRVRVGIGKPKSKISVSDFVLKDFDDEEKEQLEIILNNITDNLAILIDKKLDLFSSTINNK